jgi:probable F420-dependent oxidoreductase
MKFDVTLLSGLRDISTLAEKIDALGIDGLWTTETSHNPFLPLTLAAAHTKRTQIGTAIAVAFPRSPMVTAQLAWDLAEQSDGRFILGLGTQVKAHIVRRFSSVWDSPGPRLRDYILSMRAIWNGWQNGKPLKYEGEFYKFSLMTPFFAPSPMPHSNIPIFIAGVNPYLCKLAGETCQGLHVHPFHTAKYLREIVLPNVEQGAQEAGRKRSDVELTCAIFVVTGANQKEIEVNKNSVKAQIAFYASTPSYDIVLEAHGWKALGEKLTGMSREGRWMEMADLISDEMLEEFAVVAPYEQLATKVRERYEGLLDRVGYYFPFDNSANEALWMDAVRVLSDTKKA